MTQRYILLILTGLLALTGCQSVAEEPEMIVYIIADGRERKFEVNAPYTVEEFLNEAEVEMAESDRISPPPFTQVSDGMRITVVRVTEDFACETEEIPHEVRSVPNEGLAPGEERLGQTGQNGEREVCYRIPIEDGIPQDRIQVSQTVITEPVDEIIFVGIDTELEPVPIVGTLAYINNNNAWVIQGSSTAKRNLTTNSDLDSHVFSLSPGGDYLIYTSQTTDDEVFLNQLWLMGTDENSQPVSLDLNDVLYAEWVPGRENTISYSTGETSEAATSWNALNNLWLLRVDPNTGSTIDIDPVLEESYGGLYSWWGTVFQWSPDGENLAWVHADAVGLVDLENDELLPPLLTYSVFSPLGSWSWRAGISWSWDSQLLATVVHGPPIGNEPRENSPVFNLTVTDTQGSFDTKLIDSVGMWAAPRFSPQVDATDAQFPTGYLAYLRARTPHKSVTGEYDLVVADRDGSNARVVFPDPDLPGITTSDFGLTPQDYTWSPDGRQIALIYQGNLWVVDVESGVANQLTFDGGAEHPVWVR